MADGIAVLRPAIGDAVLRAVRRDGGGLVAVSEVALADAVTVLAARAGVGAEPAGASALAGLLRAIEEGLVARTETTVLLITGRGMTPPRTQPDLGRVRVVETLDEVERSLAGAP